MNTFLGAHFFSLPTQGNIYSMVTLPLKNGKNKTLIATLKRKVFSCEFIIEDDAVIPLVKEVPFTYIPSGAEIISIDAFNRSKTHDDFFIGITIIKVNGEQNTETYLNIYTEQDIEEKSELNLDSLAQNCLMLELPFIPYQLYHTLLIGFENSSEIVWLLSGSDIKMHLFREDPLNHTYCEIEADGLYPEFSRLPSIVLWVDIKHTTDTKRRLTAFGCECGTVKFYLINILNKTIIINLTKHFDAPVSRVLLFKVKEKTNGLANKYFESSKILNTTDEENNNSFNLLVINSLQASVVFMDITKENLSPMLTLPESDKYDTSLCGCIADINMDCKMEILIGTFSKILLVYFFEDNTWKIKHSHKFPHSIHAINYVDLTGDGIKELLVVTMLGVIVLQHNLSIVKEKFKEKMCDFPNLYQLKEKE